MSKKRDRPRYAQMSRRGLGTLHGLIVDAWRTLQRYDTAAPKDFRDEAQRGASNLHAALKLIEKKQGPLA